MKTIRNGITKENAIFSLTLGLCSSLAVTTTVESAYVMGFCVTTVLLLTSILISIIKRIVPNHVRIPTYVLIIATTVTILEYLLEGYAPKVHALLGIYLPLIIVNCIILGRCLSIYSRKSIGYSICDAIGIGVGYTLSITLIALFRESLGNGTITLMNQVSSITGYKEIIVIPKGELFPINFMQKPAGAFLTLGLLSGFFQYCKGKKGNAK